MTRQKKFLFAIPLGFAIGILIFICMVRYQLGVPTASSAWVHEIIERKYRAASVISKPKILLLGGSATLFGVKASVIESELEIPVVNGALHAGLGLDLILRNAKKMLNHGDTVVIFPEYELLDFGENNRREWAAITYLDFMLSRDPDYYLGLHYFDQLEIAMMTPPDRIIAGIKGKWFPERHVRGADYNPYDAAWIDSRGDMTGHLASRRPDVANDRDERVCEILLDGLSLDEEGFRLISDFKRWADERRVRIIAGFPNMVHRDAYESLMIDETELQLKKFYASQGIDVVGGIRESLMSVDEFFDTMYHPTEESSVRRSEKIAMDIRQNLMR